MTRTRRFQIVTTAVLALAAWLAATAGATVIGSKHKFRYVQNTITASGGGTGFQGSTDCGAGFAVVSGGTVASGTVTELRMTGSSFTSPYRVWHSTGFNTGYGKSLSTVAMCRKASPNIVYAKQTKALPASPSVASTHATCPSGLIAGGGVAVTGPSSQVHVSASYPDPVGRMWRATVVNDTGGARSFTVYAVCLPVNSGLSYEKFTLPSAPNANGLDFDLSCASSASIPLTGGVTWSGNQNQVQIGSSGPINSGGGVNTIPDAVWRVGTANTAGATKTLTGYIVCAPA